MGVRHIKRSRFATHLPKPYIGSNFLYSKPLWTGVALRRSPRFDINFDISWVGIHPPCARPALGLALSTCAMYSPRDWPGAVNSSHTEGGQAEYAH